MTITLIIPRLPESGNKTRKYSGWKRQEYRDLWHEEVIVACYRLRADSLPRVCPIWSEELRDILGLPWPKVKVTITLYFPDKRKRDEDNMRQGLKPCVDGLVNAGIIEDDEWYPHQKCRMEPLVGKYDKENPRTVIEVEEIKE